MKLNIQLFGGRGASSGVSIAGKKYETEYTTFVAKIVLFLLYKKCIIM